MKFESYPFLDTRFEEAAHRLIDESVGLLVMDVFDTLLGRRVPTPIDVFLRLGTILEEQGRLGPGLAPDSFAAIRYQTEYAARGARQRAEGDREVTLHEIYEMFPPHIYQGTAEEIAAFELMLEDELAFANPDAVTLARYAKDNDIPFALVSNMYLSERALRAIMKAAAPDLPEPDAIYVSSDHRMGKRTGLLQKVLKHFDIEQSKALLIGDNPVSDKAAALETGMKFAGLCDEPTGFMARLGEEHPRQWFERAALFAGTPNGDHGLTWLRRQAEHWTIPASLAPDDAAIYIYGVQHMGPLLTGFTAWVAARLNQMKAKGVFGITREGDLLAELVGFQAPELQCRKLSASRMSVALAAFHPDYPEHLEDFLTRRGFWPLATLMAQLGFTEEDTKLIGDPQATLDLFAPHELAQKILQSPLAARLFETSARQRKNLMAYLKSIGALDQKKLYLLDLGYAATIQRNLQRVFKIEKQGIVTHGLYLACAHVSRLTQEAGGIVEGFLAQNGNPNDFACAFCRSPEIVEITCMPPYGTVTGYSDAGEPVFAADATPECQKREVAAMQMGIRDFTARFIDLANKAHHKPNFLEEGWRKQMRMLATRMVVYPTESEARLMGHWMADSDMGLASPRAITSTGYYETGIADMRASDIASLPRRDLPWLYGIAALISPAHVRQIALLIMRRETPHSFDT